MTPEEQLSYEESVIRWFNNASKGRSMNLGIARLALLSNVPKDNHCRQILWELNDQIIIAQSEDRADRGILPF